MENIVLFSGGIDSLAALLWTIEYYGKDKTKALYCALTTKYEAKELEAAKLICSKLGVHLIMEPAFNIGIYEEDDANIPLRNLILMCSAAIHSTEQDVNVVIQNIQVGEYGPDRDEKWNLLAQMVISQGIGRNIVMHTPFANKSKQDIVLYIRSLQQDELLLDTIGCFKAEDGHCGECKACFRRYIALEHSGINTFGHFNKKVLEWSGTRTYANKMLSGGYDDQRKRETLAVLTNMGYFPEEEVDDPNKV